METPSTSNEDVEPELSPAANLSIDENASPLMGEVVEMPVDDDQIPNTPKTEKGNSEEGFCCVMSMSDGVVL